MNEPLNWEVREYKNGFGIWDNNFKGWLIMNGRAISLNPHPIYSRTIAEKRMAKWKANYSTEQGN